MDEGVRHLAELDEPGGPRVGVERDKSSRLFRQPVATAATGEREGPGLEVGRLTGRRETTVRLAAEADPVEGQAAARSRESGGTPAVFCTSRRRGVGVERRERT